MRDYESVSGQIELFAMHACNMLYNHGKPYNDSLHMLERIKIAWHGLYNLQEAQLITCNDRPYSMFCKMANKEFEVIFPYDDMSQYENVRIRYE